MAPCKFFAKGHCSWGSNCYYSHKIDTSEHPSHDPAPQSDTPQNRMKPQVPNELLRDLARTVMENERATTDAPWNNTNFTNELPVGLPSSQTRESNQNWRAGAGPRRLFGVDLRKHHLRSPNWRARDDANTSEGQTNRQAQAGKAETSETDALQNNTNGITESDTALEDMAAENGAEESE